MAVNSLCERAVGCGEDCSKLDSHSQSRKDNCNSVLAKCCLARMKAQSYQIFLFFSRRAQYLSVYDKSSNFKILSKL